MSTVNQRSRILESALSLMATNGVAGTSMRQLASSLDLNVATLYHYFPSKADLLRAVIAERGYHELLDAVSLPIDASLPPRERLVQLLTMLWSQTLAERAVWRLLVGEGLRADPDALEMVRALAADLERAIDRWLAESLPEIEEARRADVTSVLIGQLLSFFLEDLVIPKQDRGRRLRRRAEATAAVVFSGPAATPATARA